MSDFSPKQTLNNPEKQPKFMKRLIDQELKEWKESSARKSLILRGARQVGKTFAVRYLGQSYPDFYEINLEKRPELRSIFEQNLDPVRILKELSIDRGEAIVPGKTLFFLDEIQSCPQAILSLRYFYEEMKELHVIGAGSLLEFAIEKVGVPVGRVQTLTIYPMSFAEFLVAQGNHLMLNALCEQTSFSEIIHEKFLKLLAEYFVIGGFPEVVSSWINTQQISEVKDKLSTIVQTYRQDFEKYAKKNQLKYLNLLLQHIPLQIGQKFKFQGIGEYRKRELAPCLELMEKAHIVHFIYHTAGQGLPLGAQTDLAKYKVICFDIAMTQQLLGLDIKDWFLNPEKAFINQGQLVEAFVGQEIIAYSCSSIRSNLYYWQREAKGSEAEIDYLAAFQGEVVPIEVKAGKGSTLKSLHSFLSSHPKSSYGVKLSTLPRSQFEKIKSIPLYSIFEIIEGASERIKSILN